MQFNQFYRGDGPVISFEVFPPQTDEGTTRLLDRLPRLKELGPSFITVTYGALGSTQSRTTRIASTIKNKLGFETAHHLTCVGAGPKEIERLLERIAGEGIDNIVALRGDPPRGSEEFRPVPGGYRYACDLVAHIRRFGNFGIAVAGYPEKHLEAPDFQTDLGHLKNKVEAGADLVITQLFYDNRLFFRFVEHCREQGIDKPIVPGLLPILSVGQIKRITGMCGATLPAPLLEQLENAGADEDEVHRIGVEHTARQAVELLESGVAGIHFYVLNRYFHIAEIMEAIRPALKERATSRVKA